MKNSLSLLLFSLLLFSCSKNKQPEQKIDTFTATLQRLEQQLASVNDTVTEDALLKIKAVEDSVQESTKKLALSLTEEDLTSLKENEELIKKYNSAIEKREVLLSSVYARRHEYSVLAFKDAKYHIEETEKALAKIEETPFGGLEQMVEETKLQHQETKLRYEAKMIDFEAQELQSIDSLKNENFYNEPGTLVKKFKP